jgi:serine/threonine protein kinase
MKKNDMGSQTESTSSKGIMSISSHAERKYDTIPFRMDFIRDILRENELEPIIDFNNLETEVFIHPNGYSCLKDDLNRCESNGSNDSDMHDVRTILNKKKYDFYKVINEIGGKLRYIKSGTTGHTFKGIIKNESGININYAVKVVAYPKRERYGDMNDVRRPENAELMMIRLLSYFVVKKQTPHIALPIGTFYTSITPFVNLIDGNYVDKENKRYHEFVEKYKKGEYYDTVSILISEWANRGDLLDFIKKNYREFTTLHWKVVFFQIISVLAVIQSKFPSFRHNDLKANNILIHKIGKRGTIFSYSVCKKKYFVQNIGYQIKLWDFDFACIPDMVPNAKVNAKWTDEINVKPIQNRYYDLHYFFNTLIKKGFFPELLESPHISDEVKSFVNRVVPLKYQYGDLVTKRGRILINDEYVTPDQVLKTDPFFEEFRNYKPKKNNEKHGIDKLLKIDNSDQYKKRYILSSD